MNAHGNHGFNHSATGNQEPIMTQRNHVIGWTSVTSFLLFAVLSQFGCSLTPSPYDAHDIVAVFPADGAASVPRDAVLRIDTGWACDADSTLDAVLTREDGVVEALTCERSDTDEQWFECDTADELAAGTTYTFTAGQDDAHVSSTFTTESPTGRGYEIGSSMKIERFGSSPAAADGLTDVLESAGPMVMVASPMGDGAERWYWGPGRHLPDDADAEYATKSAVGYPIALEVTSDNERFHGWAEHTYMPVYVEGEWHYVRLDEVSISGAYLPGTTTIATMELNAIVTTTSILRMASLFDPAIEDLLISVCRPDLDTDGDGEDDAAAFELLTSGTPADLR